MLGYDPNSREIQDTGSDGGKLFMIAWPVSSETPQTVDHVSRSRYVLGNTPFHANPHRDAS